MQKEAAQSATVDQDIRNVQRDERIERFYDKKEVVAEIRALTSALGWGKDTLGKQFKAARSDHYTLLQVMRKEAWGMEPSRRRSYIESMLQNDPRCRWVDFRGPSQVCMWLSHLICSYARVLP